jgi:TRAP transporter TAXI family solute receptor
MLRRLLATLMMLGLGLCGTAALGGVPYKIITASERGTYIQIGRDLAKFVAPDAGIDLEVLPSAGSAENVQRLREEPGVKFAMVQSDVYQAFLDQADRGQREARRMISPLRVVMPLYDEEIYFIARADSKLEYMHEIKDAKINAGALRSGTALTATTLYRQMFGTPLPEANASFLSNEEALAKLVTDKSIDVVVVVAGQPAKLLADMKPEARDLIKLLKFDPNHPSSKAALTSYFPATIRANSYPNLLASDVPGLTVKAFLVTYDYTMGFTINNLSRFAASLCRNFGRLRAEGHPKWQQVQLALPDLGKGWLYYPPTARELRNCVPGNPPIPAPAAAPAPARTGCSQQERILGLCR